MKGKLLEFNEESHSGVISGDDGNRYNFEIGQWKGAVLPKAETTNEDVVDASVGVLVPWYGMLLNLVAGYNFYQVVKDSGCSDLEIANAIGGFLTLTILPMILATWVFPFILLAVVSILWSAFFIKWVIDFTHNEEYARARICNQG